MKLDKTLRYIYYRSVRVQGRPRNIAIGMAIGFAVGMTPTLGFQMAIAVPIAAVLGQNKITAALGCWISNPLTAIPLYSATYALGAILLGRPLVPPAGFVETFTSVSGIFSDIMLPCWTGGLITAVPVGILAYWGTYQGVVAFRLRRSLKRKRKLHEWRWDSDKGWHKGIRGDLKEDRDE